MNIWFNLFEDELFYSAVGRSQYYNGLSLLNIQEIFFGNGKIQTQKLIPTNLGHFCSKFGYDPDYILTKHSVYNFYHPFILKRIKDECHELFIQSNNSYNPSMKLGLIETKSQSLRYCPACVMEDYDLVGVPYFHVSHNLNGIDVCYKHGRFLKSFIPQKLSEKYSVLDVREISPSIEGFSLNVHFQNIARLAYDFINSDVSDLCKEIITDKTRELIRLQGWLRPDGTVDQITLATKIKEFYGESFLDQTENIISDSPNCWTRRLTRNSGAEVRAVQFLLLLNMLDYSTSDFLEITPQTNKSFPVKKELKANERLLSLHKKRLLTYKRWHPDWIRRDYKLNCRNAYQYVAKYDKQFIEKWMPAKISTPMKLNEKRYDENLDRFYLNLLQHAYVGLINKVPIIKITRYTLEKAIGKPQLLRHGNYALCANYVVSVSESTQDFRLRKCKVIVDYYLGNGVVPTLQQIRNESKLKEFNRFGPLIDDIEKYIRSSIQNLNKGEKNESI